MNEQEDEETWIPSNAAIQRTLTEDCTAHLQEAGKNNEDVGRAFIAWVNANAGALMWIGESRREQLIVDVGLACGLQPVVDM